MLKGARGPGFKSRTSPSVISERNMSLCVISMNWNIYEILNKDMGSSNSFARWNTGSYGIRDISITCTRWKTQYYLYYLQYLWNNLQKHDFGCRGMILASAARGDSLKSQTRASVVFKRNMTLFGISVLSQPAISQKSSIFKTWVQKAALLEWRWNVGSYAILDMLLHDVLSICNISDICNETNGV